MTAHPQKYSCHTFLLAALFSLALPPSLWGFHAPGSKDIPQTITIGGEKKSLKDLKNPFPADPETVKEGGEIYIKNCFLCHGDLLDGKGIFGESFFPPPTNFIDKDSIVSKSPGYAFWRIMKGGKGLPEKFKPWNSAMPAWEGVLSEEKVWKTILYIKETVKDRWKPVSEKQKPSLKRGKEIYHKKCAFCHGEKGKGNGPSAEYTLPQPRNLAKGHIKIRATSFGKIPTDEDLFKAVSHGMKGTTMPGWGHLSKSDRHSLVLYIKSLSKKFAKFEKRGKKHKIVKVPEPPSFSLEAVERGKKSFLINCSGCHGVEGRGDGATTARIVDYSSNAIWPRNLSEPWNFRRGARREDIFLTLRTGLSTTAMPKFSPRIFKDQEIWDIVDFVRTLGGSPKQPQAKPAIKALKVNGKLTTDLNASFWKKTESFYIPLGGQILESPKSYFPTVKNLTVKAAYNEEEIAFKLRWDDPSFDPALKESGKAEPSPVPPLPEHMKGMKEEPIEPVTPEFPDAIALQFPVNPEAQTPYFLNGEPENPVNLWKWTSAGNKVSEWNATGAKDWSLQHEMSQAVKANAHYRYGQYSLVVKRKRNVIHEKIDTQFKTENPIPIAFNVWDGYNAETGAKKSISSWFALQLEK